MNDINFDKTKPYAELKQPQTVKTNVQKQSVSQVKPVNDVVNLSKNMLSSVKVLSNEHSQSLPNSYSNGQVVQVSSQYAQLLGVTSSQALMTKIIGLSQNQATLETDFGIIQVNTPLKLSKDKFAKNNPVFETTSNIKFKHVLLNNIINGRVIKTNDKSIIVKTPLGNMELDIQADINAKVKLNIVEQLANGKYKIQVQIEQEESEQANMDQVAKAKDQLIAKTIGIANGTTKTLKTFQTVPNSQSMEHPTKNPQNPQSEHTNQESQQNQQSEKGIFIINNKQRFSILIKRGESEINNKQQSSINVVAKVVSSSANKVTVRLANGQEINLNNNNLNLKENEKVSLNIHSLDTNMGQNKAKINDISELEKLFSSLKNVPHEKTPYINLLSEEKTYNTLNLINSLIPRGMPLGAGNLFVAQAMFSMMSINNPTIIANIIKIFMGINPEFKDLKIKKIIQESTRLVKDKQHNKWKSYNIPFMMEDENNFKELKVYHRLYNDEDLNNESVGKRFLIEMNLSSMGGKLQLDGITKQDQRIFDLIIRTNQIIDSPKGSNIKKIFIQTLNKHGYKGTLNFSYNKIFVDYTET